MGEPIDLSAVGSEITGDSASSFDLKDIRLWGTYTGRYNSDENAFADLDVVIWMQGGTLSEIMTGNGSTAVCRSITVYMSGGTLTGENSKYNSAITASVTYVSGGRIEQNLTAQLPRYLSGSPSIGGEGCGITVKTGEKFYLNGALNGADVYVVPQGDFADGTVIAEASGSYTIAENDIAQLHLTGDYAQGKELYLEDNQVKIRAAQSVVDPDQIVYLDETGAQQTLTEGYTLVSGELTTWESGWYVVDGNVTINSRVTVNGDVKLILKDNANLTVNGGLLVRTNDSFTVYAQSQGSGALNAISGNGAGIGGGRL